MEFEIQFPKEEFSDFLNEYIAGGHESDAQTGAESGQESALAVEYDGGNLGAYLGSAGLTVLIGLVVVIGTLLMLTGIFKVFGIAMGGAGKPKKMEAAPAKAAAPAPAPAPVAAAPAPVVQSGITDEVVAVIAAAVAAMAPGGKKYAIKRVSRADAGGRSPWAAAGIADNTRPF